MCHSNKRQAGPSPPQYQQSNWSSDRGNCHKSSMTSAHCKHAHTLPPKRHCTCKEYDQDYYVQSYSRRPPGTVHPAIGIPLSIVTCGLSCAAFGIYRGVKENRAAAKAQKAMSWAQQLAATEQVTDAYVRPSPVALKAEMPGHDFVDASYGSERGRSISTDSSAASYISTSLRKVDNVSEVDSTPLTPPPGYNEKAWDKR
ncbi:hypothetical protein LTR99_001805 [Exophiala xenobiotica]|uniref:Uncharacterized protein n=1 Tax=Vermiconidia calcicola TaxID=1690605 RepID=A0AAV9Q8R9_9PEZI|nr:hypothetical protein LTR41_002332 [Exophiala xenobiotica]KAK5536573.1 hypothetical protein LTR25_005247 [Vermiconidia calcicola]KAK5543286.1 hypothetical protein LTR23_004763 [Chaetothyriales sp. CCFEE 6169]KAK5217768.1 hypothetical protein LTR72_009431 [Exophiala xenobiotica]KAK5235184.1 hypothetical protein LTR47_004020 [Exophiala xenobiotica]